MIELKSTCSRTTVYDRKERADCAAEHVKARMTLVTEKNVTIEKVGRVFESLVFLPFVRIHDTPS